MKRCQPLLFVVPLLFPYVVFAQESVCVDYAKLGIGFTILLALLLTTCFAILLISYFFTGGRKYLKRFSILLVFSLLLGVTSVTVGLVKEYSKNTIPFLHPYCIERTV